MFSVDLSLENIKMLLAHQISAIQNLERQVEQLQQRIRKCEAGYGIQNHPQTSGRMESEQESAS